jgi:hypothetical protein
MSKRARVHHGVGFDALFISDSPAQGGGWTIATKPRGRYGRVALLDAIYREAEAIALLAEYSAAYSRMQELSRKVA